MSDDGCVPLSVDRHRGRFWRRFASYDFARHWRTVPLVLAEVEPVAAAMPILFSHTADGPRPVALLRLVPGGTSAFVSPQGLWLATHVPSLVRVHPFSARDAGNGRMVLMVDEGSGLVTGTPTDEPFFGPDGALAGPTTEVVDFFRQREASALQAREACAALDALGLLVPAAALTAEVPADTWDGLSMVDRAAFAALGDADHLRLRKLGCLGLVHAHFVSLAQIPWLRRAEALRDAAGTATPPQVQDARGAQGGVEDFMAALAAAQEEGLTGGIEDPADAAAPRSGRSRNGTTH